MLLTIKIINLYNINNSKFIYISPLGWTPSADSFGVRPAGAGRTIFIFFLKNIKYYKYIINIL